MAPSVWNLVGENARSQLLLQAVLWKLVLPRGLHEVSSIGREERSLHVVRFKSTVLANGGMNSWQQPCSHPLRMQPTDLSSEWSWVNLASLQVLSATPQLVCVATSRHRPRTLGAHPCDSHKPVPTSCPCPLSRCASCPSRSVACAAFEARASQQARICKI